MNGLTRTYPLRTKKIKDREVPVKKKARFRQREKTIDGGDLEFGLLDPMIYLVKA